MATTIDVNELIERQGVTRLARYTVFLCFLMMICDGYDFGTLNSAAPLIIKEWHVQLKDMGFIFGFTFIGLAIGSAIYSVLGDWLGRRNTIIFGTFNFGIPILATIWAQNPEQLFWLRFLGGIGMGGIVPIAYTLTSEYASQRMRSTLTTITNFGYTVGGFLTGQVAGVVFAPYGWHALFVVGALFSLALGVLLYFTLPESATFLAQKRPDAPQLPGLVRRLTGGAPLAADARFVARDVGGRHGAAPVGAQADTGGMSFPARVVHHVGQLFGEKLAWVTPLLWILFVCDSLGFFFLGSWLPVIFTQQGQTAAQAAQLASWFVVCGAIGGFGMMRFYDTVGPIALVAFPIIGAPLEILSGTPGLSFALMYWALLVVGVCLGGTHYSVYAIAVRYYPPRMRANGVSCATVFGRLGGAIAPTVGGFFLQAKMPLQELMIVATLPSIGVLVVSVGLGVLYRRYFDTRFAAVPAAEEAGAAE